MRSRKAASQRGDLGAAAPLPLSSVAMRSRNSTASLSDSAAAVVLCQHLFTQHHDGSEHDLILLLEIPIWLCAPRTAPPPCLTVQLHIVADCVDVVSVVE